MLYQARSVLATLAILSISVRVFAQDLFVPTSGSNEIKRYSGKTGAFLDVFVAAGSGGLGEPSGIAFGPDGNMYVGDRESIKRFNGHTGAFIDQFVGGLTIPGQLMFAPDGNLYVANRDNGISRFNGKTGAPLGNINGGGLGVCLGIATALNGNLLAASQAAAGVGPGTIKEYDMATGAFVRDFVPESSGGLTGPLEMRFGKDGNLYVSNGLAGAGVLRYNGTTGDFIDQFVPDFSGGLHHPCGMDFGPDGNLYVGNKGTHSVLRFNGISGDFMDNFAFGGGNGGDVSTFITFGPPPSLIGNAPEPGTLPLFFSITPFLFLLNRKLYFDRTI